MANISISLDEDLILWIDELIERGVVNSRSEAVRGGLYEFIKKSLNIKSRKELRSILRKKQKKEFQNGSKAIRAVRKEE